MKIHIVGDIFSNTGYSSHCRQLANAIARLNPETSVDVPKPPDWVRYCNDQELKMLQTPYTDDSTVIAISQPITSKIFLADNPKKFYQYVIFEGDLCPQYWIKHLLNPKITGILVPSQHTYKLLLNTIESVKKQEKTGFKVEDLEGIKQKLHIIPHGCDLNLFHPKKQEKKDDIFTFSMAKGWSQKYDRGGIQWGIKAFNKEFGKEENVCMKIKINTSYNLPNWNLHQQLNELKLGVDGGKLLINTDTVEYNKLIKFYNDGDVFVSCSMADAFDLPVLEAQACGLPSIVTANNGHCDFVNEKNGWIINKGEFVEWSKEIQYEGVKWFKPDITEIRKKMRYCFEHQQEVKQKGKQALKDSQNFTWENSAKKLLKIVCPH